MLASDGCAKPASVFFLLNMTGNLGLTLRWGLYSLRLDLWGAERALIPAALLYLLLYTLKALKAHSED